MRVGRTAVVAGASGLVGGHLLDALLACEAYTRVLSLGRRPSGRSHPKLEERVVELAAIEGTSIPSGADVFVALGTTLRKAGGEAAFRAVDLDGVVGLGRAARRGGAARLVAVSALGADPRSRVFYSRVKGEAEEALAALGLPVHLLRPSLLLGERGETRRGEAAGIAAARAIGWALVGPLRRYRAIEARTVALAMLAEALRGGTGRTVLESEAIEAAARTAPLEARRAAGLS